MKPARRGSSLLEASLAVTLLGVTMTTVTLALHGLYRADRRVRQDVANRQSLERLITQLRRDAHVADRAAIAPAAGDGAAADRLTLIVAARTVQYRLGPLGMQREVTSADEVLHRDTFRFHGAAQAEWQIEERAGTPLVLLALRLERSRPATAQTQYVKAALRAAQQP